ncbi:MAG: twin-arginine translocase TatA/TatE family subunit [Thermoleophilaceae bacterium]|jgi:sec-independent protein translocase protein TatA|nr:twin-arginine translocase TatA/TatE family subunit [Thermoleophilaceae bacterium]
MFGGIAPMELIIIAVIALVVLGPKRLPDAARSLGKGMREMREAFATSGGDDDDFDTRRFENVDEDEDDDLDGDRESEPAAGASSSVPAEKA